MRVIDLITLILLIIGGLNWGLVGLADFNLVEAIFGRTVIANIIYIIVGLSALWQLIPLSRGLAHTDGTTGEVSHRTR